MSEFFHGWRRKIGCLTLVMACVVCGAWVRSFVVDDLFEITFGSGSLQVVSVDGRVSWDFCDWDRQIPRMWTTFDRTGLRPLHFEPQVRYWSLAIPLSLLSAYLILWKQRKRSTP